MGMKIIKTMNNSKNRDKIFSTMIENAKNGWRRTTFRPLSPNAPLVDMKWRRVCTWEILQ